MPTTPIAAAAMIAEERKNSFHSSRSETCTTAAAMTVRTIGWLARSHPIQALVVKAMVARMIQTNGPGSAPTRAMPDPAMSAHQAADAPSQVTKPARAATRTMSVPVVPVGEASEKRARTAEMAETTATAIVSL